jgi:hypoxanthine-DNA glycosylase
MPNKSRPAVRRAAKGAPVAAKRAPAKRVPAGRVPAERVPAGAGAVAPWLEGLPPVIASRTRLIVLGSFPGVASLEARQYYAHPRNHFWPIVGTLLGLPLAAMPYDERVRHVRARGLGLWDVYARCRRHGSLDQHIEDAEFVDLESLKRRAPGLAAIAHNGGESARAMRHTQTLGVPVWRLPSTSPANAGWSFDRKLAAWRQAFEAAGLTA